MNAPGAIPHSLNELRATIAEESARQGVLAEFVALFLQFILRSLDALIVMFAEHQARPLPPQLATPLPTVSRIASARPSRTPAIRRRAWGQTPHAADRPASSELTVWQLAESHPPLSATAIHPSAPQPSIAIANPPNLIFETLPRQGTVMPISLRKRNKIPQTPLPTSKNPP